MNIHKTTTGQGEDVVIIHGWGGCDSRHMQPVVDQLAKRYRVTNIDLPGRGGSDWVPTTRTIHDMADQLLPILPKQAIYVGWSFGGVVSMSIAARYPELVKRLIGIGTTPKFIAADGWLGVQQPGFKANFNPVQVEKTGGFNGFFQGLYDAEFANFNPKPAAYHQLIDLLNNDAPFDLNVLFKGVDIIDAADLRKEFASIKAPIDLILGGKDGSMPIVTVEQIKKLNPKVQIHTIPNGQHLPFWTHPQEFNKILNGLI